MTTYRLKKTMAFINPLVYVMGILLLFTERYFNVSFFNFAVYVLIIVALIGSPFAVAVQLDTRTELSPRGVMFKNVPGWFQVIVMISMLIVVVFFFGDFSEEASESMGPSFPVLWLAVETTFFSSILFSEDEKWPPS